MLSDTLLTIIAVSFFLKLLSPPAVDEIVGWLENINRTLIIPSRNNSTASASTKPISLVFGHHISPDNVAQMEDIVYVLKTLGYDVVYKIPKDMTTIQLIWTFEWPFGYKQFSKIRSTQMINHFVNTAIFNKATISTLRNDHVPPSFRMPIEYPEWVTYARSHIDVKWLSKRNTHRGISMIKVDEFAPTQADDSFVQQLIHPPLLIDGFKIDIGVYVLVTSAVPLRVYVLDHEIWIRACLEPYFPFKADKRRKYIIDHDHRFPWDLPSFDHFFQEGSTLKQAFLQYLSTRNYDGNLLFAKIDTGIRETFTKIGHKLSTNVASNRTNDWSDPRLDVNGVSKHFELLRFDFLIQTFNNNNDLKPWLMEVNFSPNLWSANVVHAKRIYRQIIYDVLSITSATNNQKPNFFKTNLKDDGWVSDNDLHIRRPACSDELLFLCASENATAVCIICRQQWPRSFTNTLKQTTSEQLSRRYFRRLLPPAPKRENGHLSPEKWLDSIGYGHQSKFTLADKALATWLFLKCQKERHWCG